MRQLLHWQFVVPRLLLVVVVLLAAQFVLGIAARSIAIRSGESAVGARVEVGHARVSFVDGQVVFSDLRVAKRRRPSESCLEADQCELNFAPKPLLYKQAVVESGRVSGLRFSALTDGSESASRTPIAWFKDDADLAARKWLDQLAGEFRLDLVKQCGSVARTEAFCANWSKRSAALESRLEDLDGRAADLQQAVEMARSNPLRNDKLLVDLPKKVADLQKDFTDFRAEVEKLPDVLETERRAIVAARCHDDEVVNKRLRLELVNANALTAYLLREQTAKQLDQLVGWLRWVREMAPGNAKPQASRARGENVLFAGRRPEPGILIRALQLEGAVRIAGQPVELRGVLTNLASKPRFHDQPIRLHLIGNGSLPLELQATIDRTGPVARDELLVDCQGILLPAAALGRNEQLAMHLAPSIGMLSVSVVVDGDQLTGDIQMVQQKVQLSPTVHGTGSATLATAMGETLGRVKSIATRLSLGGTLDEPKCTLWSNLGAAVAEALERALHRTGDQYSKALLVEAGRQVDERLAEVDRQVAAKQAHFADKATDITARLQKIVAGETPRYRISAEHGGRRLPNNSLFR